MQLTLKLRGNVSAALREHGPESKQISDLTQKLGLELHPMVEDDAQSVLSEYWVAEGPETIDGDSAVEELSASEDVESAYIQPVDELA